MKIEKIGNITLICGDCEEYMNTLSNTAFDLAIVDPPYGINADAKRADTGKNKHIKQKEYHVGGWDKNIPPLSYFIELQRVSRNQIIWGGNYFLDYLKSTPCMIIWDKDNGTNCYADCEIAWTSFNTPVRKFRWKWHGFLQENNKNKQQRIHPTEKPIQLYKWLLENYAEPGQKIIDTHGGSMSIAIAAHDLGFELTIIEKDEIYYEQAKKRLINHQKQLILF